MTASVPPSDLVTAPPPATEEQQQQASPVDVGAVALDVVELVADVAGAVWGAVVSVADAIDL